MSWIITGTQKLPSDPDAAAYIASVEAADGQALEYDVRMAINAFVKGCKSDGIWPAVKASCILAGARTLNGALVPLAGAAPTNYNFVSGDYDRKTGLIGDGGLRYLASNRTNNADPQNNRHKAVFVTSSQTSTFGVFLGGGINTDNGADYIGFNPLVFEAVSRCLASTNAGILGAPSSLTGFLGTARSDVFSYSFRFNGNTNSVTTTGSSAPTTGMVNVFRRDSAFPASVNARIAFYSIGESLDLALLDARVTTLINAFAVAIP